MQTLFELQSRTVDPEESLAMNMQELGGSDAVDTTYACALVLGVTREMSAIKDALSKHAPEWPIDRMDTLTRSILLIGAYEILFANDAPPAVVMNEAIEIAKEYGPAESPKFVNGVLNAIAHRK
jgi:N utilization substance protein B